MSVLFEKGTRGVLLVGDYGSGKTEVAVNLAVALATGAAADGRPRPVALADLDLVNPYFRCREAAEPLEALGIRVVIPRQEGHRFADLPILLPEVRGLLQNERAFSVLDVGGDEAGSRVLAGLGPDVRTPGVELWFVANGRRPFEGTSAGCVRTVRRIEASTGLRVTGLVSNTHLMDETTTEMVLEGLRVAEEAAVSLGVRVRLLAALEGIARSLPASEIACPVLPMQRLMVPPWVRREPIRVSLPCLPSLSRTTE